MSCCCVCWKISSRSHKKTPRASSFIKRVPRKKSKQHRRPGKPDCVHWDAGGSNQVFRDAKMKCLVRLWLLKRPVKLQPRWSCWNVCPLWHHREPGSEKNSAGGSVLGWMDENVAVMLYAAITATFLSILFIYSFVKLQQSFSTSCWMQRICSTLTEYLKCYGLIQSFFFLSWIIANLLFR